MTTARLGRAGWIAAWIVALLAAVPLTGQDPADQDPAPPPDAEVSCRVCHPGAAKGLLQSPHRVLNDQPELAGRVCAACHGDLSAHAGAVGRQLAQRPAVPRVTRSSCAACHPGADHEPGLGSHLLAIVGSGAPPLPTPDSPLLEALEQQTETTTVDWSGFAELGYRFVHYAGSREAYRTDVDLHPTVALRAFELRGTGGGESWFDDLSFDGNSIGDPRWDVGGALKKADRFDLDSRFDRGSYLYAVTGDYHRVDRSSRDWTTALSVGPAALQVFGSYSDREQNGYWLTQRISNRNLAVQTVVDGVQSPRHRESHEGELGIRGELAGLRFVAAAGYLDERAVDRWDYSQPAVANPGFTESENLAARTELSGPTGRLVLAHDGEPFSIELSGIVRDLDRDLASAGTSTGFDTVPFSTVTTASGLGKSRLRLGELDAALALTPSLHLRTTMSYRDLQERQRLVLVDVQTSTTTVTTTTTLDDDTVQRLFDGELAIDWQPGETFDLTLGYGLAREQLRVLSPGTADPGDFRRGHLEDEGVLAALRWQFEPTWTLRAEGRDYATDGVPLSELTPQRARTAEAALEWHDGDERVTLFARHRHRDNAVSSHRLDVFAAGLNASINTKSTALAAGYTFADTVSRTRTSFYFDPDPDPVPTLVGFTGQTHTWTFSLVLAPEQPLQFDLGAAVTRTTGSLDVTTMDAHAGLRYRCCEHGAAGLEWRHARYADETDASDWHADLVFLYWRQEW
ncbi:MAG: MtrB/PioB family outer membrane beta-barrel protein [Planctomycetes bacterium]|nr:MtrB/PioB family outer membrane beta-barrel protein [Planctomycetota bacterium]